MTTTDRTTWAAFEALDSTRRMQGLALDAVGLGPIETPYETVLRTAGANLRRYGTGAGRGPAVLIVPAPIKRPYIWDLAPGASAVRRLLDAGTSVFLLEWERTGEPLGLADYADRLIGAALDAAGIDRAVLLAHSLGGLFTAVFAALHPERVSGIGLLATPLHFERNVGIFSAMADALPAGAIPASVPGSFLGAASLRAAPETFGWDRFADLTASLGAPAALATHLRVERWTLDEFPLPGQLLADLAALAREDAFVGGTLTLGDRHATPAQVTAPLLCVVDPRCRVVPPAAVLPFLETAGSSDKTLLHYDGDVGVSLQHVGLLVGLQAHARLWPQITRWVLRCAGAAQPRLDAAA